MFFKIYRMNLVHLENILFILSNTPLGSSLEASTD